MVKLILCLSYVMFIPVILRISDCKLQLIRILFIMEAQKPPKIKDRSNYHQGVLSNPKKTVSKDSLTNAKKQSSQKTNITIPMNLSCEEYSKIKLPYFLGNNRVWKSQISKSLALDVRLKALKYEWIYMKNVADIGCGQGLFTTAVAKYLSPASIHGIDIDKENISKADSFKKSLGNMNQKSKTNSENDGLKEKILEMPLFFQKRLNNISNLAKLTKENAFNTQFSQMNFKQNDLFPLNLTFINKNLFLMQECIKHYDTVLCMKLTKWIHLAFGDQGIQELFMKLSYIVKPGGILILEAQAHKSYKKMKNVNKIYEKNYKNIMRRPQHFKQMLIQYGMELIQEINLADLEHPIQIYRKKEKTLLDSKIR